MTEPDAAPPTPCRRRARSWVVFLAFTAAFAAVQLAHNTHLFSEPIYEDLDYAANSLLVLKAKRLELLHGHYSRMGFYHPGPALLYVLAAAEWALHDVAHVVPAPHNAHMLAHPLLNAVLLGAALTIVSRAAGLRAALAAALAFLVYFAREGQLNSHWFAQTFFLVYLPFQIAAASVAAGRSAHLGWLALTASLAVHCHASFVLFVVPISLYALARLWARGGFRVRPADARVWRSWAVFAAVVGLFVLPIVLHTALNFPGEIRRYVEQRRLTPPPSGGPAETARFLVRTLTSDSPLGWPLAAGVVAGAVVSALTFPARGRRFVQQTVAVGALSSGAMTYYAARGVDDYQNVYLGIFFGSVLLLGWALIAMRVAVLGRGPAWRAGSAIAGAGVAAWACLTGLFHNPYPGAPDVPALAEVVAADPRWEGGPPLMTVDGDGWIGAGALLVQLERRGRRPWLIDPHYQVIFTDAFRPDGRPISGLWQLDAAGEDSPAPPTRRVLARFRGTTVRELETRCPFGGSVPVGGRGRLPGAKPIAGWSFSDDGNLIPVRARAALLIDLAPCPARAARLALRALAMPPPNGTGQRVRVTVNGEDVGEMTFPAGPATEQGLVFAGDVLNRKSPVRIDLAFPDAGDPSGDHGPRARTRLSVVIGELSLSPAP
ncbi:MAG: hypothetical protein J0I06_26070 [Planctomycetes bacterium]|nr:hypothetical protein [Planctomycetota bacterium]